jgi:hypothetical protein
VTDRDMRKSEVEESAPEAAKEEATEVEAQDSDGSELPSLPIPKSVRQFIQSFSMTLGGGFPALGFMDKVKDEHITQFFDHVEEESKREAADRKSQRRYWFATYVFTILAVLGFIAFLVNSDKSDLLVPVLTYIATLIGGFGAGWGLGRRGRP